MKPKKSANHLLGSRFTFSASPLSLGIGIVAAGMALLATYTAHAASQTWDGGASTTSLNDANNWTNNLLPSASGDTGTWDATVPGALSLTWSTAGFGSTTNGFNVNIASGHTGTLRLDAAGTAGALSLGTITIANGAGAFSLGDGAGTANVTLRGTNTFTNNDNDTATINSDVFFASGGGSARTITFAGTGNWDVYDGFALSGSGSIKLAKLGAGTLTLNAAGSYSGGTDIGTTTVGSAAVVRAAATQALGSGTLAILGNDGNNRLELSGGISLNNALTLSGRSTAGQAAILNVSGNNTFSGLLTMTTGGNQYAIESASGTLALTNTGTSTFLDSNRVLTFQGAGNGSFDGTLAGSGGLTKAGTGTWTLTGANSYSGATNVNAGTLAFTTNAQSLGSSVLSVADGAGLSVKAASAGSTLLTTGNLTLGTSGTTSLTFDFNNLNPTVALVNSGVFTVNGTVSVNLLNGALLGSGTHALIDYSSFAGSGVLPTGSISLGSRSSGTLVNDVTNTVLNLNVVSDTPKWTGLDSGAWVVGSTGAGSNWKLINGSTATDYIDGDVTQFDDTAAGTTSITINSNVSPTSATFNNSSLNYTLGGAAGIAGAGSLTKNGTAALTIGNANSYTGGTVLNAGTLNLNNAGALGVGAITVNGGTLDNTSGGNITLATNHVQGWNGDFTFSGTNSLDMGNGNVTVGGTGGRAVTVNAGLLAVGELRTSGTGQGFTKSGAGTLELGSVGATTAGSIINGVLNAAGGTLQINRSGAVDAASGDLTAAGIIGSGTITNGAAALRGVLSNPASGEYDFSGTIADGGTGVMVFVKQGAGTQVLSGNNTYTGFTRVEGGSLVLTGSNAMSDTITVAGGTLDVRNSSALGTAAVNATSRSGGVQLQGGITLANNFVTSNDGGGSLPYAINNVSGNNTINGTITLTDGGGSTVIQSDSGTLTLAGNITIAAGKTSRGIILQGNSTASNTVSGAISNLSVTSVASVTKNGTGTWTLSGASTYTGATNVTGGTLVVNGNISTSSLTTVSGGTLKGSGLVGNLNITTGVLAPGTSIESLGTGNVTLGSASTFEYELNSASLAGDLLYSSGTLAINPGSTLTLVELASGTLNIGDKLTLISYTGAWNSGLFTYGGNSLADDSEFTLGANQWRFDYNDTSGGGNFAADQAGNFVTMTVIPEPATATLGLIGMLALLRRRR